MSRLVNDFHGAAGGLVTVRLAALSTDEIAGPTIAYGPPELAALARDLGVWTSIDAVFGMPSSEAILRWARMGDPRSEPHPDPLDGTDPPEAWTAMADAGVTVALAPPTSDAQIGLDTAVPAVDEALAAGIRPGLSIDVEVALASDMFTQMRTLHAIQRMRATNAAYGTEETRNRITTHDVLDFATLQGAHANALGHVTGSLTPPARTPTCSSSVRRRQQHASQRRRRHPRARLRHTQHRHRPRRRQPAQVAGSLIGEDIDALREDVIRSRDTITRRVAAAL